MDNLEKKVEDAEKKGFVSSVVGQVKHVGEEYLEILKNPRLVPIHFYRFGKDILYELPRSFFVESDESDLKKTLEGKLSQTIGIAEIGSIIGRYAGVGLMKLLGADDYTAAIVGGNGGDYALGVLFFIGSYVGLTRRYYPAKQGFKDSLRMIRNILPSEIGLYLSEAPIVSGLIYLGMEANMAVTANYLLHFSICTGVFRKVANSEITIKS